MSSVQAVFLFDVNAFKTYSVCSKESLQEILLKLRVICLRILSEISGRSSKVRWGFKFFNSDGSPSQKMAKMPFCDADLESYEKLETEIGVHFERSVNSEPSPVSENLNSYGADNTDIRGKSSYSSTSMFSNYCPIKIVQLALTQVLCEYSWDVAEVFSPVKQTYKEERSDLQGQIKNYVFLVSQCPTDSASFANFFGRTWNSSFAQEILMPRALHEKFVVGANIRLIWLDTYGVCSQSKVLTEEDKVHQAIHKLLVKLSGALVPLKALFQNCYVPIDASSRKYSRNDIPASENDEMCDIGKAHNSISVERLLPFSSVFNFYVTNSCHYNSNSSDSSSSLVLGSTTVNIKVMPTCDTLMRISKKSDINDVTSRPYPLRDKRKRNSWGNSGVQSAHQRWCKFTVQNTVVHTTCICPQSVYVCYPLVEKDLERHHIHTFRGLMQLISRKKLSLVVKCESNDGFSVFGVLSYLSLVSATIVVFDSSVSLVEIHSSHPTQSINQTKNQSLQDFILKELDSSMHENVNTLNGVSSVEKSDRAQSKPFAMCSMERWFVSRIDASAISQQLGQTSSRKLNPIEKALANLYKSKPSYLPTMRPPVKSSSDTVFKEVRKSPRLKRSRSAVLNISKRSASLVERSFHLKRTSTESVSSDLNAEINHPVPKEQKLKIDTNVSATSFTNEKDLLEHLHNVYSSALQPDGSLISCAQTLINVVKCYIQSKNMAGSEAELKKFIEINFLLPVAKINEKYDGFADTEPERKKKIKEYKMQVVLTLELESVLQPASSEDCIEKVTGILRAMSFVAGPADLNQFLYDVLKTNYNHTLHEVLIEIGDELNVPFVSEILSPSSVTDTASSVDGPDSTLSLGSILSAASSSSVANNNNNKNNRQRMRRSVSFLHGTDPSGGFQRRQILIPQKKPRTRSQTNSQLEHPVRHSPRLAAKRAANTPPKPERDMKRVCRNLFDTEKGACNMIEGSIADFELSSALKRRPRTPKGHRILKTEFVSITPPQIQGIYLNEKLKLLRRRNSVAVSSSGFKESPFKTQLRKGSKRSSCRRRFVKNYSFYGAITSSIAERLKLQKNSNEETFQAEMLPSFSPSKFLPDILNSPAIKHPARRCSRKLFTTNSPIKKQHSPRKKSASVANRKFHQGSTAEIPSKDVDSLKPRKLFVTNSPVKKQHTPQKYSTSVVNKVSHQRTCTEVLTSPKAVHSLKSRKRLLATTPSKKQCTPRKNVASSEKKKNMHQRNAAEMLTPSKDVDSIKPVRLFATNTPVKKHCTPQKNPASFGKKKSHQKSVAEELPKAEDVDSLKSRKRLLATTPAKKQCTPRKNVTSSEKKKNVHQRNAAEMLTPSKDVDSIKPVRLFASNTPVKKHRTPQNNPAFFGKKRSHRKSVAEEFSKAEDVDSLKPVKLFVTNSPVKKQHASHPNSAFAGIRKSEKRNCKVHGQTKDGSSFKFTPKNTGSTSAQVSSCQKCTPVQKTEEFSANQLKISQNCSFTPPTPLSLLHLTTSPVVLLTKTKLKT